MEKVEEENHQLREDIKKLKIEKQLEQARFTEEKKNFEFINEQTKKAMQEKENLLIHANEENRILRNNLILYREEIANLTLILKAENPVSGEDKLSVIQLAEILKDAKFNAERVSHGLNKEKEKLERKLTECQYEIKNITDLLREENFTTGKDDSSAINLVIGSQLIKKNCHKLSDKISEEKKVLEGDITTCETTKKNLAQLLQEKRSNLSKCQKENIASEGMVSSCLLELKSETNRLHEKIQSLENQYDTCKKKINFQNKNQEACRLTKEKLKEIITAVNTNHNKQVKEMKYKFNMCQDSERKNYDFITNDLQMILTQKKNQKLNLNGFLQVNKSSNGTSTEPIDKNMSTIDILKAVHRELSDAALCEKQTKEIFDVIKIEYQNITLPKGDGNHSITVGNATALQMLQELKRESTLNKEQLLLAQDEIEEITNFAKDLVALGTHNLDAYSLQANETPLEHSPATIETLNDLQRKLKRTQELLLLTNDEIKNITEFSRELTGELNSNPIGGSVEEVNDTNPVLETTPIQILQDWQETLMQAKEKLLLAKEEIKSIALSTRDLINSENENSNASSSQSSNPIFVTNATATQRMKDLQQDLKSAQEQLLLTKDGILDIKSFVRNLTDLAYENANLSTGVLDDTFDRTTTMSALNLTEWQGQLIQSQNQLLLTADDIENIAKYAEDIIELGIKAINTSLGQTSHSVLGPNASAMEILQEWQRKFKAVEQQALLAEDEVKNIADFTSNTFSHILTPPNGTITEYFDKNASTIEILKAVHRELAAAALCHTATGPNASSIDLLQHWQTKFNEMQQQALLAKDEMKNISDYTTNTFSDILGLPNGTSTEPLDKNMSTIDILKAVHRELSEAALCEKQMKELFDVIKIEYQNITLPRGDGNPPITVENATALQMLQEWKAEQNRNKDKLLLTQDKIENITSVARDLLKIGNHNFNSFLGETDFPLLEANMTAIQILKDVQRNLNWTQEVVLPVIDEIRNISKFSRDEFLPFLASDGKASSEMFGKNYSTIEILHAVYDELVAANEKIGNASDNLIPKLEKAKENLAFCENERTEIANAIRLASEDISIPQDEENSAIVGSNATLSQTLEQWQREIKKLRLKLASAITDSQFWMNFAMDEATKNAKTVPTEEDRIAGANQTKELLAELEAVHGEESILLQEEKKNWDDSCFLCQDQLKNITEFIKLQTPVMGNNITAFALLKELHLTWTAETAVYQLLLNECKSSNEWNSYLYHQSVASLEDIVSSKSNLEKYVFEENSKLEIQREIIDAYVEKSLLDNLNAYTEKINSFPL
ncbi:Uncharacterized protein APZ42_024939 [Daphnia magna]|uniref:Uncharacterized protein n=1 Tax=Daphnia magna TaxID=35525 RepID=A0A164TPR8_9CRUS|nr:Uncharacterized protein APZ42_024939 [Daphnia magna]